MQHRNIVIFCTLAGLCLTAIPLTCMVGQFHIAPGDVMLYLFASHPPGQGDTAAIIVRQIRLARAIVALLCGGILATAGAMLQGVLRNPLADPFTLGISAGAACGASIAIATGGALGVLFNIPQSWLVTLSAMVGALLALGMALILGHAKGSTDRETLILAGIAVASFLGAIVALVKALNEESVTSIVFWILGSLQNAAWTDLYLLLGCLVPGIFAALLGWRKLDVLFLGDQQARWLGLNAHAVRIWILLGASIMTAGCVAVVGVIAFVGLVVPHILRLLMGGGHGPLLLASFPAGGLFLLLADCAARIILDGGQELPVGIITALAGAPFFAFLIWQRKTS